MIQESKFLGGDMEHTHLVKGLDFALLQKVSADITVLLKICLYHRHIGWVLVLGLGSEDFPCWKGLLQGWGSDGAHRWAAVAWVRL